jgi:hypothetical protein
MQIQKFGKGVKARKSSKRLMSTSVSIRREKVFQFHKETKIFGAAL